MAIKVQSDWKSEAEGLEFNDLEERLAHYRQLRDGKMEERRKLAVAQIKELMAQNELSIDDVADKPSAPGKRTSAAGTGRKMAPKYRNPENPEQTWSGQGIAPRWMPEDKEQRTDFLIKPE